MAEEDAAEVDDKKEVFQKILRRRVGHLEKLLKGNWHGLDLLKGVVYKILLGRQSHLVQQFLRIPLSKCRKIKQDLEPGSLKMI